MPVAIAITEVQGSRGRIHWREERTKRERLEESLLLLRQHHKETLEQLHSEAERLQRENRGSSLSVQLQVEFPFDNVSL